MVMMRSLKGMKLLSTLSMVVLPVPVPPLTRMLRRSMTQARRNMAAAVVMLPISTRSSIVSRWAGNFRTVSVGPLTASGGMIGVDARAVGQPGVDQRLALVDAPAHLGHDPLDDRLGHLVGNEAAAGLLDHARPLDVDLVAGDDHDFRHRRRAQQVLQRPEAEDRVLQVFFQRPQDEVLAQLVVQMRADEMEDVVEAALHAVTCWLTSRHSPRFSRCADELQEAVQFGSRSGTSVAGTSNSFDVSAARSKYSSVARLHDELVDQVVAERQAGDLLQQRPRSPG